jgi:predicted DNA-binding transcriptional regulator AlpA
MSLKPDNNLGGSTGEDLPDLLTAKDLERLLKIDVKTIYSYAQKGLLPYVRIQSNLRFEKSEILHWIEGHRFRPKSLGSRR